MKHVSSFRLGLLASLMAAVGVGCGNEVTVPDNLAMVRGELARAKSCDDLLDRLQRDALYKSDAYIDAQIYMINRYYTEDEGDLWGFGFDKGMGNPQPEPPAMGGGEDMNGSGGASSGQPPPEHSETNTQVAGVDEADIVKTDGNYLYVLHGQELAIVAAWPVEDLALSQSVGIEGQPLEMFVSGDKVVVYSRVDAGPVYQAAGVKPPPTPDYYYGDYGAPDGYYGESQLIKTTVLSFDGSTTEVLRELYFEGSYASSRRVDNHVRSIFNGIVVGPQLHYSPNQGYGYNPDKEELLSSYEALRLQNRLLISASNLDDYLSRGFERTSAGVEQRTPSCTDFYVPSPGSTTAGMVLVESLDLDNTLGAVEQTSVVGTADVVYSSQDALYIAGHGWNELTSFYSVIASSPMTTSGTHIHKFDLVANPAAPSYVASATVWGYLNDQFSLDEHEGALRVAVTGETVSMDSWNTANHLFTFGSSLQALGAVTDLAPGETIYAARFVGERGYIVTFRQVDPLFAFDLSDPSAPKKLGELKIPGFSTYMHPIEGGDYLLTIGQGDDGWGSPALQIFDVRDGAHPTLVHKRELPGGETEAEYSHKAFTFYQGMLAIPFTSWDGQANSSLELFDIDVVAGITPIGSISHSAFFDSMTEDQYYCSYYGGQVRRGVFIDDYIYSVSEGGVIVNDLTQDLSMVASLALPTLSSDYYDCGYYY